MSFALGVPANYIIPAYYIIPANYTIPANYIFPTNYIISAKSPLLIGRRVEVLVLVCKCILFCSLVFSGQCAVHNLGCALGQNHGCGKNGLAGIYHALTFFNGIGLLLGVQYLQ